MNEDIHTEEPLGLPRGSVRSLLSLGVVLGAFAIAVYLLVEDTSSDLTKVVIGGWIAALGNVIGFLFRRAQPLTGGHPLRPHAPSGTTPFPARG